MTKRKSYFINVLELATRNKMALDFLLRDRLLKKFHWCIVYPLIKFLFLYNLEVCFHSISNA
jgi:hypothetical protein